MTKITQLRSISTANELADLLNFSRSGLAYAVYKTNPDTRYSEFEIPKKSGGTRKICAPCPELKGLQSRLSDLLYECQREVSPPQKNTLYALSHGFQKKRGLSIQTNASIHKNRKFVLNVDLEDFFPSIHFGRVCGFFEKNSAFALDRKIAILIAQISCHNGVLPQGAPTSPIISDLIASVLDQRLHRLARKHKCSYSRYADDLTFSTNQKSFPTELAEELVTVGFIPKLKSSFRKLIFKETAGVASVKAGRALVDVVERAGFKLNPKKTRLQLRNSRQTATGLVVNRKVNVSSEYSANVRAMCHALTTKGKCYHPKTKEEANLAVVKGMMEFLFSTKTFQSEHKSFQKLAEEAKAPGAAPVPSHFLLYRRLLAYEKFHALDRPLIICEGKTDNVYISCAINSLAAKYPKLAPTIDSKGIHRNALGFLKHTQKNADILSIAGGAGQLHKLVANYKELIKNMHPGGRLHPVIVIIDNDSAAKAMWSTISNVTDAPSKIDGTADYYHINNNLFVVPIPTPKEKSTAIEDLFEEKVLATKLDGKAFDRHQKARISKTRYSKAVFSEKVIKANAENINFDGFIPLLDRLNKVVSSKLSPSK